MSKVWTAIVEVDFPIEEGDLLKLYDDDTHVDFIWRATERLKAGLGKLTKDGLITHFKVVQLPHVINVGDE